MHIYTQIIFFCKIGTKYIKTRHGLSLTYIERSLEMIEILTYSSKNSLKLMAVERQMKQLFYLASFHAKFPADAGSDRWRFGEGKNKVP